MIQKSESLKNANIFKGSLALYFFRFALGLFALILVGFALTTFALMTYAIVKGISNGEGEFTVETFGLFVILMVLLWNCFFVSSLFLNMYPEVAIGKSRLWYRCQWRWQSITLDSISEIRDAKTAIFKQGIVVYSDQLPIYFRFLGRIFGGKSGRALYVPDYLLAKDSFEDILKSALKERRTIL